MVGNPGSGNTWMSRLLASASALPYSEQERAGEEEAFWVKTHHQSPRNYQAVKQGRSNEMVPSVMRIALNG